MRQLFILVQMNGLAKYIQCDKAIIEEMILLNLSYYLMVLMTLSFLTIASKYSNIFFISYWLYNRYFEDNELYKPTFIIAIMATSFLIFLALSPYYYIKSFFQSEPNYTNITCVLVVKKPTVDAGKGDSKDISGSQPVGTPVTRNGKADSSREGDAAVSPGGTRRQGQEPPSKLVAAIARVVVELDNSIGPFDPVTPEPTITSKWVKVMTLNIFGEVEASDKGEGIKYRNMDEAKAARGKSIIAKDLTMTSCPVGSLPESLSCKLIRNSAAKLTVLDTVQFDNGNVWQKVE